VVESKEVHFRGHIRKAVKVIVEMKHPRTEKEIQGFLGRIQYISRFIAQLTMNVNQSSDCLRRKFLQYGMNNAKKPLKRSRTI